ncbi:flagellin lysine-N-methylase [Dialister sp.]|uniref:flagellin lysine-N-methylase n=1 Tax=Dialister sp. TaxID=1955814 RepID=UPI002E812CBF|nr:flagellin lysine-N-methylase [Dialister sp.]MEE3453324.1 flagellin lysine-N-methylase [Dialister sp.]
MIHIFPSFFPHFSCKADRCLHTCCQTWEIDIDPETEKRYRETAGPLGKELSEWMKTSEDGSTCFRLNEKGFCHFLTEKGLCRLYLEKGPSYMCDICTAHPRFYKYTFNPMTDEEVELSGTGLCCERTVEQIFDLKGPITFSTPEGKRLSMEEILHILGSDSEPGYNHFIPEFEEVDARLLLKRLSETEPIDEEWTENLIFLKNHLPVLLPKVKKLAEKYPFYFDNLYQYILFRQLDRLESYDLSILIRYVDESLFFTLLETARTGDPLRSPARWSEQIEYDTDNVTILLDSIAEEYGYGENEIGPDSEFYDER